MCVCVHAFDYVYDYDYIIGHNFLPSCIIKVLSVFCVECVSLVPLLSVVVICDVSQVHLVMHYAPDLYVCV